MDKHKERNEILLKCSQKCSPIMVVNAISKVKPVSVKLARCTFSEFMGNWTFDLNEDFPAYSYRICHRFR